MCYVFDKYPNLVCLLKAYFGVSIHLDLHFVQASSEGFDEIVRMVTMRCHQSLRSVMRFSARICVDALRSSQQCFSHIAMFSLVQSVQNK